MSANSTQSGSRKARHRRDITIMHRLCLIETWSYVLLIAVGLWRRLLDGPNLTLAVGLAHGIIFLVYSAHAIRLWRRYRWPTVDTVWLMIAAIIPGGAYYATKQHPELQLK